MYFVFIQYALQDTDNVWTYFPEAAFNHFTCHITYMNFQPALCFEGWKLKEFKCYWIKEQLEPLCSRPLIWEEF